MGIFSLKAFVSLEAFVKLEACVSLNVFKSLKALRNPKLLWLHQGHAPNRGQSFSVSLTGICPKWKATSGVPSGPWKALAAAEEQPSAQCGWEQKAHSHAHNYAHWMCCNKYCNCMCFKNASHIPHRREYPWGPSTTVLAITGKS